MKTKGYPKEKLTLKNIRSDLWKKLRKWWAFLVVFVGCFIGLCYVVVIDPAFLFRAEGRFGLPGWVYVLILYPVCIGMCACSVWRLYGGLRLKDRIVTDRLISAESDSWVSANLYHNRDSCTLHFARFGDYDVPEKNHTWSKQYNLSCMGEYYHASEGDEYYLVLSKPHNGKILLAYNTKMFYIE